MNHLKGKLEAFESVAKWIFEAEHSKETIKSLLVIHIKSTLESIREIEDEQLTNIETMPDDIVERILEK